MLTSPGLCGWTGPVSLSEGGESSIENSCGLTSGIHHSCLNPGLPYRGGGAEGNINEIMDKTFLSCLTTKIKAAELYVQWVEGCCKL